MMLPDTQSEGASTFTARCSQCHTLPHPARHTANQWKQLITEMELRMQERKKTGLSVSERTIILDYLQKHARN
jgi:hypothetical protein